MALENGGGAKGAQRMLQQYDQTVHAAFACEHKVLRPTVYLLSAPMRATLFSENQLQALVRPLWHPSFVCPPPSTPSRLPTRPN
jgi:hypothetical protein